MYQYELSGRSPGVYQLPVHLPDEQDVYFWDEGELQEHLQSGEASKTMLLEYFKLNAEGAIGSEGKKAVDLYYEEIPDHFSWTKDKKWKKRLRNIPCATRISYASPKEGERFYLRLLLSHVKGARSFLDLKTVGGCICNTFRDAAMKLDLLASDNHYDWCLREAASWMTGRHLRELFAMIIVHNSPSDPNSLWNNHKEALTDDCEYHLIESGYAESVSSDEILAWGLYQIRLVIEQMGGTWTAYHFQGYNENCVSSIVEKLDIGAGKAKAKRKQYQDFVDKHLQQLNVEQSNVFSTISSVLFTEDQKLLYLDGPGGTGKTFLLNMILNHFEANGQHMVAVASSGVAAQLLLNGQTAHYAFKIPFKTNCESICRLSGRDEISQQLKKTSLIVWDEISMQHRYCIECVDRSLRHLLLNSKPFGGISVIFAGDFRQTLPIEPGLSLESQLSVSLKATDLWQVLTKFKLTRNIRLLGCAETTNRVATDFAKWLLKLGSGELQMTSEEVISIDEVNVKLVSPGVDMDQRVIDWLYDDLSSIITTRDWVQIGTYFSDRMLITPLNKTVRVINRLMSERMGGKVQTSLSVNIIDEECFEPIGQEYLNTVSINNFPEHTLHLRPGLPVILLRNLNVADGLCNGTRLIIIDMTERVLQCRVISGPKADQIIFLPKIWLIHEPDSNFAVKFSRQQFPIAEAFCLTINKAQGQSLNKVGILLPNPVFSHGQLYVALSRCRSLENMLVSLGTTSTFNKTKNVVLKAALEH